jgi:hypothetical protein
MLRSIVYQGAAGIPLPLPLPRGAKGFDDPQFAPSGLRTPEQQFIAQVILPPVRVPLVKGFDDPRIGQAFPVAEQPFSVLGGPPEPTAALGWNGASSEVIFEGGVLESDPGPIVIPAAPISFVKSFDDPQIGIGFPVAEQPFSVLGGLPEPTAALSWVGAYAELGFESVAIADTTFPPPPPAAAPTWFTLADQQAIARVFPAAQQQFLASSLFVPPFQPPCPAVSWQEKIAALFSPAQQQYDAFGQPVPVLLAPLFIQPPESFAKPFPASCQQYDAFGQPVPVLLAPLFIQSPDLFTALFPASCQQYDAFGQPVAPSPIPPPIIVPTGGGGRRKPVQPIWDRPAAGTSQENLAPAVSQEPASGAPAAPSAPLPPGPAERVTEALLPPAPQAPAPQAAATAAKPAGVSADLAEDADASSGDAAVSLRGAIELTEAADIGSGAVSTVVEGLSALAEVSDEGAGLAEVAVNVSSALVEAGDRLAATATWNDDDVALARLEREADDALAARMLGGIEPPNDDDLAMRLLTGGTDDEDGSP